jgi:N-acetylmuramoyl-L-alanine amidase
LESWRFNTQQNQLELTTDEGVQPQAQIVSDPTRLVIDLPGVILGRAAVRESYTGAIQALRIGQFDQTTTRIVIELAPGYTLDPQQIKFRGISAQQWVVTLPSPQRLNGNQANMPPTVPVQPPQPTWSSPSLTPVPQGRAIVIIDPGHGGPDPGAVGVEGLQEKGIVLDIGRQVAGFLQQRGIQAFLTRADDRDLDLEPRVQMAEQAHATVFVSIHANSIDLSRPDISGLETYYFQSGADLADVIHQTILQSVRPLDRGVRTARFYVLRKTSMPSVLVEVGFVTGRDDAMKLSTPSYRTQMADAIARGILQYLQRTAKL